MRGRSAVEEHTAHRQRITRAASAGCFGVTYYYSTFKYTRGAICGHAPSGYAGGRGRSCTLTFIRTTAHSEESGAGGIHRWRWNSSVPAARPAIGSPAGRRYIRQRQELVRGAAAAHETQPHRHLLPLIWVVVVPVL